MIIHLLPLLNQLDIILASASPRRLQLLTGLGLTSVTVIPSTFPETLPHHLYTPASYAIATSRHKAEDVFSRLRSARPLHLLISADTVVVDSVDGRDVIVEKPRSADDARRMLSSWSGRSHRVVTGVTLMRRGSGDDEDGRDAAVPPVVLSFHVETIVRFSTLSSELVDAYVASGEPMDKAGAYGVQGLGSQLIEGMQGDYFNVVGLPVNALCQQLLTFTQPLLQRLHKPADGWQELRCPHCHCAVSVPQSACSTRCVKCDATVHIMQQQQQQQHERDDVQAPSSSNDSRRGTGNQPSVPNNTC